MSIMTKCPSMSRRPLANVARLACLAAALGVAGCSTKATTASFSPRDYDYRERHPILISEEPETLTIPVGMNGPALSREIDVAIRNYVAGYFADGTGKITIQVPVNSANEIAAGKTGKAVHYALVQAGVPRSSIVVAPYAFNDFSKTAAMRLSYLKVKASTPTCGIWPEEQPSDYQNRQYHNFGCASQQNLAAMVANPADFVAPRRTDVANGARRAKVINDYSIGAETASSATLSGAVIGGQ